VLHGIDQPNLWHGNTLTGQEVYGGLFEHAPGLYDVVLTNPPFGGKESKDAQTRFAYKTGATQLLFLQHVIDSLKPGGRCGIVLDEGVLFRTNETAFVPTKRKLLDECDLYCIVSLPGGVFTTAGAGVKTNLLFFDKGRPTERICYYDLSDVKVGKKTPLTSDRFEEFFALLAERADSERSWTIDFSARKAEAKREADPLRSDARATAARADVAREQLKSAKKSGVADADEIARLEERVAECDARARELNGKAQAIEDAAFDLKAVNPSARRDDDERTPDELIASSRRKAGRSPRLSKTSRRSRAIRSRPSGGAAHDKGLPYGRA